MSSELLDGYEERHSDFQMWRFIVGLSGVTAYGMFDQAQRELAVRTEVLRSAMLNLEAVNIRTARVCSPWRRALAWIRPFGRRILALQVARVAMERESIVQSLANTKREAIEFERIIRELKEQVGELTPERRKELDEQMWLEKTAQQVALEALSTDTLSVSTLQILTTAPDDWSKVVIARASELFAKAKLLVVGTDGGLLCATLAGRLPGPSGSDLPCATLEAEAMFQAAKDRLASAEPEVLRIGETEAGG